MSEQGSGDRAAREARIVEILSEVFAPAINPKAPYARVMFQRAAEQIQAEGLTPEEKSLLRHAVRVQIAGLEHELRHSPDLPPVRVPAVEAELARWQVIDLKLCDVPVWEPSYGKPS